MATLKELLEIDGLTVEQAVEAGIFIKRNGKTYRIILINGQPYEEEMLEV